jgi:hypothetical protein
MSKVLVSVVRYDMDKTKKRNRKNLLVETKTEDAVIAQLERIHKGEKVVEIKEIIWEEDLVQESIEQAQK